MNGCIYYQYSLIFLRYIDNGIYAFTKDALIDTVIEELQAKLELMDEGQLSDYLEVSISIDNNGEFHLTQPHSIDQIFKEIYFRADTKQHQAMQAPVTILKRDKDLDDHKAC